MIFIDADADAVGALILMGLMLIRVIIAVIGLKREITQEIDEDEEQD